MLTSYVSYNRSIYANIINKYVQALSSVLSNMSDNEKQPLINQIELFNNLIGQCSGKIIQHKNNIEKFLDIIRDIFAENMIMINLIKLLIRFHCLFLLSDILSEYLQSQKNGVCYTIITAPNDQNVLIDVTNEIKRLHKADIDITILHEVDSNLLFGFRVKIGYYIYDYSSSQLMKILTARLKNDMNGIIFNQEPQN